MTAALALVVDAGLKSRCTLARICEEIEFIRVIYNSRDHC